MVTGTIVADCLRELAERFRSEAAALIATAEGEARRLLAEAERGAADLRDAADQIAAVADARQGAPAVVEPDPYRPPMWPAEAPPVVRPGGRYATQAQPGQGGGDRG